MSKKYFYVYKITKLDTQQYYIGVRSSYVEPESDTGYWGSGIRVLEAIKKYGKNCFKKEILKTFSNWDDAVKYEKFLVTEKTLADPLCYNLAEGGGVWSERTIIVHKLDEERKIPQIKLEEFLSDGWEKGFSDRRRERISNSLSGKSTWIKGKHLTEEQRKHISERLTGRKLSEEHKANISRSHKGKPSPKKGMHFGPLSEEHRKKISESVRAKGYRHSEEIKKLIAEKARIRMTGSIRTEQAKQKSSVAMKSKIWVYQEPDRELRIESKELQQYLDEGWLRGRLKKVSETISRSKKGFHHTEESKRKIAEANKKKNYIRGRIYLYSSEQGKKKLIFPEELETYLAQGWQQGRVCKNQSN